MKIVHEFYGRAQTTGSGKAYIFPVTAPPPEFYGFRCELMAADCHGKGKDFKEGDALYLKGDGKALKYMLKSLLVLVEAIEQGARDHHKETVAKTKKCDVCHLWWAGEHDCEYFKNKKLVKKRKAKKAR